jgi:hypothetical protein
MAQSQKIYPPKIHQELSEVGKSSFQIPLPATSRLGLSHFHHWQHIEHKINICSSKLQHPSESSVRL